MPRARGFFFTDVEFETKVLDLPSDELRRRVDVYIKDRRSQGPDLPGLAIVVDLAPNGLANFASAGLRSILPKVCRVRDLERQRLQLTSQLKLKKQSRVTSYDELNKIIDRLDLDADRKPDMTDCDSISPPLKAIEELSDDELEDALLLTPQKGGTKAQALQNKTELERTAPSSPARDRKKPKVRNCEDLHDANDVALNLMVEGFEGASFADGIDGRENDVEGQENLEDSLAPEVELNERDEGREGEASFADGFDGAEGIGDAMEQVPLEANQQKIFEVPKVELVD